MSSILADQKRPRIWAQMRREGGELWGLSQWVQLYTGAQINFGDLTPYLTYEWPRHFKHGRNSVLCLVLRRRACLPPWSLLLTRKRTWSPRPTPSSTSPSSSSSSISRWNAYILMSSLNKTNFICKGHLTPLFLQKPEFKSLNLAGYRLSRLRSYLSAWSTQPGGPVRP